MEGIAFRRRRRFALLLLGAALLSSCPCSGAAEESQVLVMRDGVVWHGEATPQGDRMLVRLAGGGEIRLLRGDVWLVAGSLEEALFQMRRQTDPEGGVARLRLAHWCLDVGLLDEAQKEVEALKSLLPGDLRAAALERQIESRRARPEPPSTQTVLPVSFDEESSSGIPADRLSAETVRRFTQAVQPMLINRCGAGACHGGRSTASFRLAAFSSGGAVPRKFTQQNLEAVLGLIDFSDPEKSNLLAVSRGAHAGREAIFVSGDSEQYQQLVQWVRMATGRSAADSPALLDLPPENELQPAHRPGPDKPAGEAERPPARAADPFDPAVFNRLYHPDRPAAGISE